MNASCKLLLTLAIILLPASLCRAEILFSDTFDRADSTDIDALGTGMSGTLSPLSYVEAFEGSGVATSTQILSNQLNVAMGPGMSSLFLDHNFTDAAILSADGFSVSMDVVTITAADDTTNRFGGFGIGNTRAEAMAAADSFDSLVPFRPNTARANMGVGVSDFFVDLALDQNLRVWSNGNLLSVTNVGAVSGTILVNFYCSGFSAAAPVTAVVYFNGVQKDMQTFAWDNASSNYLGISGRTAAAGVLLDNLSIATITQAAGNITVAQSSGQTIVTEGAAADDITISISSNPLAYPVTIDIADVLDPDQVTLTPAQLVFTSANWQTPQTVIVTAIDDADMERATHDTALHMTVTADPASVYDNYALTDIAVSVNENDCGAWGFNPADFNLDCQVNLEDFAIFVSSWIACSLPDPECQDYRN